MPKEKANPTAIPAADKSQEYAAAPAPDVAAAPAATVTIKTCPPGVKAFQPADVVERRFMVQIPHTDTFEDILAPEYWAHHAAKVSPRALLTCIDEHLRWEAELRVLEAGQTWLKVAVIRLTKYNFKERGESEIEKLRKMFKVEANGQNGWRVLGPSGQPLVSGLATEANAQSFLNTHLAAVSHRASAA